MYIPIGDRILVTKHKITEDVKTLHGIILPEGFKQDTEPPDLLKVEAIGTGPHCDFLNLGDMVITHPNTNAIKVFTSKDLKLEYHIISASNVIGRARMVKDEIDLPQEETHDK